MYIQNVLILFWKNDTKQSICYLSKTYSYVLPVSKEKTN